MSADVVKSSGLAVASGAYTTSQTSPAFFSRSFTGIQVFLDVTAASGTGGLTVKIQALDPITGGAFDMYVASTAVTATGEKLYVVYPSASAGGTQVWSGVLPEKIQVTVVAGDASSYTYSVSYTLLP